MSYSSYILLCRDPICLHISLVFTMKIPIIYYAVLAVFCILTLSIGIVNPLV
jgi:hypothetical protein